MADAGQIAAFFDRESSLVARDVLGALFLVDGVGGRIVETEAYRPTDPASHSYVGPTPRNAVMFGGPAHLYVYRSYGIHWCANFVCKDASALLIRALEPVSGIEIMQGRRGMTGLRALCSGPGKVCQALAITGAHNGLWLTGPPFSLDLETRHAGPVSVGPRIGISKAVEMPWRFGVAGSGFVSRKF